MFLLILYFFSCEKNIFLNGKILMKLDKNPKLNKFET